jgi:hypothetical protein
VDRIIDHLRLLDVTEKLSPSHVFTQVVLMAAEARAVNRIKGKSSRGKEEAARAVECRFLDMISGHPGQGGEMEGKG